LELKDILRVARYCSIATILPVITPWLLRVTKLDLIPDPLQPVANGAGSLLGAIVFLSTFAALRSKKTDEPKLQRVRRLWLILLILAFMICFFLRLAAGSIIVLGRQGSTVLWWIWTLVYAAMCGSLSGFLCVAAILSLPRTTPQHRKVPLWLFLLVLIPLLIALGLLYILYARS
jgi:hypothetical protein